MKKEEFEELAIEQLTDKQHTEALKKLLKDKLSLHIEKTENYYSRGPKITITVTFDGEKICWGRI